MKPLGCGCVAYGFDIVPVRANDKRRVIVGVIVRTEARCTVVFAASGQACPVERIDFLPRLGNECDVKRSRLLVSLVQTQGRTVPSTELYSVGGFTLGACYDSKRLERLDKEGFACSVVTGSELDVIKHGTRGLVG